MSQSSEGKRTDRCYSDENRVSRQGIFTMMLEKEKGRKKKEGDGRNPSHVHSQLPPEAVTHPFAPLGYHPRCPS
jgi:hypothetical protein